jgi:circadian clock protein KaiC
MDRTMRSARHGAGYTITGAVGEGRLQGLAAAAPLRRVPSGVAGLDEIIEGGLPQGRIIGLTGATGSGKTTLGMQFLEHGITEQSESGVFVTLEDEVSDVVQDMSRFGWDLPAHIENNRLAIVKSFIPTEVNTPRAVDILLDDIHAAVTQVNAKRLVFDSLSALGFCYTETTNLRRDVLRLCALLRELGCTVLMVTEMPDRGEATMRFGLAQFVTQGMLVLHMAHAYRALEVRKMRGTRHDINVHRLHFTDHGLKVNLGDHPF